MSQEPEQNSSPSPDKLEKTDDIQTVEIQATPALPESLLVLGLMAVFAVSCWLLYGPLIRGMIGALVR